MLCARSPRTRAVLFSAIFIGLAAGMAYAGTPKTASALLAYTVDPLELQVVQLVNNERALRSTRALTPDARLWQSSESHSQWMASVGILSHTGSGGSNLAGRAVAAGYSGWTALGEVIGVGYPTAADIVNGWKGSASHWPILMNPVYRDIGVGVVADGNGSLWWTTDLGNNQGPTQPLGGVQSTINPPTSTPFPTSAPTRTPTNVPPPTATRTATNLPLATASRTPTNLPPTSVPPTSAPPTATLVPSEPTATPRPTLPPVSMLAGHAFLQARADSTTLEVWVDSGQHSSISTDGSFIILGVPPGEHILEARATGWLTARKTVLVPPSQFLPVGDTRLLAGDVYPDGRVTQFDVELIRAGYGRCLGTVSYQRFIDLDLSGCIDAHDAEIASANVGRSGPTNWTMTP